MMIATNNNNMMRTQQQSTTKTKGKKEKVTNLIDCATPGGFTEQELCLLVYGNDGVLSVK